MSKKLTKELIIQKIRSDNFKNIKKLNLWGTNLDDISLLTELPNLEIISLSVNKIRTLKPFSYLSKLRELYLRKNMISDLNEIKYLIENQHLRVLWLSENPICENPNYRNIVISVLPQINKLDDIIISEEERINANKGISIQMSQIKKMNNNIVCDNNYLYNFENEKINHEKILFDNNNNSDYYDEFIIKEKKNKKNKSYDDNNQVIKINKKKDYKYEESSSNSEFFESEIKKNNNIRDKYYDNEIRRNNYIDDDKNFKKKKRRNDCCTDDYRNNFNERNYNKGYYRNNNNLLNCVLMLLDELNDNELDIVKRKIEIKNNNNYY